MIVDRPAVDSKTPLRRSGPFMTPLLGRQAAVLAQPEARTTTAVTDAIALLTLLIISSVVATAGVALICDFRGSAATLADRVDRFLSRWPAWFRDDRGSYDRTAIRWWGLTLLAAGALPVLSVLAGLADKGRAGQAHALLILPLAALGAVMFAIGRLSARYRRKQTTVQAPLTSVLVSFVSFAVVLLAFILTRRLGY